MLKRFVFRNNKAAGNNILVSLFENGFQQVKHLDDADFAFIDMERRGRRRQMIVDFLEKPVFVYPHTPLAYFLWDAGQTPLPIKCNFVHGQAAKASMQAYGYPNRIETYGFSRCKVLDFAPTLGKKLLFVPARSNEKGRYASSAYQVATHEVWQRIYDLRHLFESINVVYVYGYNPNDWPGVIFNLVDPRFHPSPDDALIEHIDRADIVVSCETVGCLAVARGKPTVFYNTKAPPTAGNISARNYELYRKHYQFPIDFEDLTTDDLFGLCKQKTQPVELWKDANIGGDFCPDKISSVISEYL